MSKSLIWSVGVVGVVVALVVGSFIYISNKAETDLVNKNTKAGIDLYEKEKTENPNNSENPNINNNTEAVTEIKKEETINNENNQKNMTAILKTNKGEITIELNPATPKTVENFVKLANAGFYNGTKFHRVIKGFMNQGGDPLSKDDTKVDTWGTGGPGYKFADEITSNNKNDIYTIAMANSGPNTNGSQFFINVTANNFLDTKHTVFGKVTAGIDVVTAINNVPTNSSDRPLSPVILESVTIK